MAQFVVLRNKDIIGFSEDSNKKTITIFLSSGNNVIIYEDALKNTLTSYEVEDIEHFFNENVWRREDDIITFGDAPLNINLNLSNKAPLAPSKEPAPKKKSKF